MFSIFRNQPQPLVGEVIDVTPDAFNNIQQQLQPLLAAISSKGEWIMKSTCVCCSLADHNVVSAVVYIDSKKVKDRQGRRHSDILRYIANHLSVTFPIYEVRDGLHLCIPTHQISTINKQKVSTFYHVIIEIDQRMVDRHICTCGSHEHQLAIASLIKSLPQDINNQYRYRCGDHTLVTVKPLTIVSDNLDEIAQILIGPNATGTDLASTESIISAVGGINSPRLTYFVEHMLTRQQKSVILHF